MLHLRLRALLLLGSLLLQAHLLHLPLAHQLSVILLVIGGVASSVHVGVLLHRSLLLLLGDMLLLLLLLSLMRLILCALLGAASIAVSAVRNISVGLVRGLVVVVRRCIVVRSLWLLLLLLLLLLRVADTGSGVHCILTHLTRRLRLVLQLFCGKVGELDLGHLRITCSQLILNLYDSRDMARG
jgi:hypothetical protein